MIRSSTSRWRALSSLLAGLESSARVSARLDAYSPIPVLGRPATAREERLIRFDRRMDHLACIIDRELDRLTVEHLNADLARKKAKAA